MGNRIASVLRSALTILAVLGLSGLLTLPLASDDRAVTRRTKLSPAGKVGVPPPLAGRLITIRAESEAFDTLLELHPFQAGE